MKEKSSQVVPWRCLVLLRFFSVRKHEPPRNAPARIPFFVRRTLLCPALPAAPHLGEGLLASRPAIGSTTTLPWLAHQAVAPESDCSMLCRTLYPEISFCGYRLLWLPSLGSAPRLPCTSRPRSKPSARSSARVCASCMPYTDGCGLSSAAPSRSAGLLLMLRLTSRAQFFLDAAPQPSIFAARTKRN